ncbi:MAG: ParB N-terminal domain-containing protein [Clostridia bacterium]|nr:ParB N-terminal domain-containing protein [Clostridia bacterium]
MNKYFEKTDRTYNYDIFRMEPMPETPFKFREDDSFQSLIESIDKYGLLSPITVIPHKTKGGFYEVISGIRRLEACKRLGYTNISCMVCDRMTRDEALIFMVDSNLCSRDTILPSEKAAAYKIKLDAMKRQGYRTDLDETLTSDQVGQKSETSVQKIADECSDSKTQIQRYIRLNELQKPLLDMVDEGRIAFTPAVELSYLSKDEQTDLIETIQSEEATPSLAQAQRMRKLSENGELDMNRIFSILTEVKGNQKESVSVPTEAFSKYVKGERTPQKYREFILKAVEYYCRHLERQKGQER